ncbi:MAG: desulfoferrodoxin [Synergistales bacterium]|nr:desulfoferrodoxin [Synergistales bacterium]
MTERMQVYRCGLCGNMVEVLHSGAGEMFCCGESMKLLEENTADSSTEKHVPVTEGRKVKVGSVPHPMKEEHYIEWIEIISGDRICRTFLKPGELPEAIFEDFTPEKAREYCNIHGLWRG